MSQTPKRVVVTGGAGQIAYSLLFRIANGDMLGPTQPVILQILEIPEAVSALEGVKMELQDCAFPLLKDIRVGSDPREVFEGADYALLVGSKPRGPGMERKDLLTENGRIFVGQGQALNDVASPDVKVLVVGNPCNTNALICMANAPRIPRENFHAMTRLDQNRAQQQIALKAGVDVTEVSRVTIWGNHSSTQVPDFVNAKIQGEAVTSRLSDRAWLEGEFVATVQQRGAAIIKARGKSSAASAANAALDAMRSLVVPTPEGQWFSSGICSDGNPYGVEENLIFSFPCRCDENGKVEIVRDLPWDDFLKTRMEATQQELMEERECVAEMVNALR